MDVPDRRTTVVRRTLLAACLVLAPLLIAIATLFMPPSSQSGAEEYANLVADRSSGLTGMVLFAIGAALFVPGSVGIAQLVRGRGSGLLTTGAAMVGIGGMAMAMGAWSFFTASFLLTEPGVAAEAGRQVFEIGYDSPVTGIAWMVGTSALLGFLVVAAGLLRAGAIEKWKAAVLAVGPFAIFFSGDGVVGALAALPLVVGLGLVADRVRRVEEPAPAATATAPAQRTSSDAPTTTPAR